MDNVKKYGLKEQVALLPLSPGVYQFLDKNGTIIYVGKAKSLRKRVSSYFMQNKEHSAKVQVLVRQIAAIRHIVVDTETDALLLENSLIKTLQPRYNILLKDDKTYPWIVVRREPFPRVQSTRILNRDGSQYFGPYGSVMMAQYPGVYPRGDSPANLLAQPFAGGYRQRALFGLPAIPPGQLQGTLRGSAKRRRIRRTGRYDGFDSQRRPAPRAYLS